MWPQFIRLQTGERDQRINREDGSQARPPGAVIVTTQPPALYLNRKHTHIFT
jgi:hypothetical protein